MKPHLELRAAEMRARMTEEQRVELWAKLDKLFRAGRLTAGEVSRQKREFWEARAQDEIKVREARRQRNYEAVQRNGKKRSAQG